MQFDQITVADLLSYFWSGLASIAGPSGIPIVFVVIGLFLKPSQSTFLHRLKTSVVFPG